jgi:hypothetical protein
VKDKSELRRIQRTQFSFRITHMSLLMGTFQELRTQITHQQTGTVDRHVTEGQPYSLFYTACKWQGALCQPELWIFHSQFHCNAVCQLRYFRIYIQGILERGAENDISVEDGLNNSRLEKNA